MSALPAALTSELEMLIQRGARLGELDLAALVDTYAGLTPSSHPRASEPRQVDLDALVGAFSRLPPGICSAPRLRLVARLAGFAKGQGLNHHVLSDGTMLVEIRYGMTQLAAFVASLCVLEHERRKAHHLFEVYGGVPDDAAALITHMALALGVDEVALMQAQTASGGILVPWLTSAASLPAIAVQPDVAPAAGEARARAHAQRVVAVLAESGLLGRPLHVWLGPSWVVDCLSPFARELRPALTHWAASSPPQLGSDLTRLPPVIGEDALYAITHDLLRLDTRLSEERAAADRTVGIYREVFDDTGFEIVDLARVEIGSCDPRVSVVAGADEGYVLVRVPVSFEDQSGAAVRELVEALGERLARLTVVLEGMALAGGAGSVVQPEIAVHWAGDALSTFPTLAAWDEASLLAFSDTPVTRGAIVSVPTPLLLSATHIEAIARRFRVAGIEVGHAGCLRGVSECMWSGRLAAHVPVSLAMVGTTSIETGRGSVRSIAGVAALAVASLAQSETNARVELDEPPVPPPPVEPQRPAREPRDHRPTGGKPHSGRGFRIKA